MSNKRLSKITALFTAFASALAITGLVARRKRANLSKETHIPEPSVRKVSRVRKIGSRKAAKTGTAITADVFKDMLKEIRQESLSNEDIAKIIMSLVNLQNVINPGTAIDIRDIHFIKSGKQSTMVIDFYTGEHGKQGFIDELDGVWRDVFLAEDFWNADFAKVRVNVKDKKSGDSIESITCTPDNIQAYLTKEIPLDSFLKTWARKETRVSHEESSIKKVRKFRRA